MLQGKLDNTANSALRPRCRCQFISDWPITEFGSGNQLEAIV
jgi:hypothetical protein